MSVWEGNPGKSLDDIPGERPLADIIGRLVDTLPETYQETAEASCRSIYQRFRPA